MRLLPRFISGLVATTAAAALLPLSSQAADPGAASYPHQPITMIMGFNAGSGVDVIGRVAQEPLGKILGQPVIIDYKSGAAGNIGSEFVARAKPDGYTIYFGTAATHGSNAALYKKLPFDVEADFVPVAPLVDVANVLTINPNVINVKNLKEFVDEVKAHPGKYNYASTGNGTGTHLAFAEFVHKAGLEMVHVPYKGGPEAIQSVLAGDTCCIFNQVQTALPQWRAGKVRLLGVTTAKRVPAIPDVPTIAEAGVPGYESYTWFGIFAPKGLDPAIAAKLNAAIKVALDDPATQKKMVELGNTPRYETLQQFKETVHRDRLKWAEVVKAVGATIE